MFLTFVVISAIAFALFKLGALSVCRKRELLDAKWEHFDLERRSWRIPLSKSGVYSTPNQPPIMIETRHL